MALKWHKNSFRRHSADVGPLRIEVRRVGIAPDFYWRVGEVFGNAFLTWPVQGADRMTLEEAKVAAEEQAMPALKRAMSALEYAMREKARR